MLVGKEAEGRPHCLQSKESFLVLHKHEAIRGASVKL